LQNIENLLKEIHEIDPPEDGKWSPTSNESYKEWKARQPDDQGTYNFKMGVAVVVLVLGLAFFMSFL
jgi:hypothetical protein